MNTDAKPIMISSNEQKYRNELFLKKMYLWPIYQTYLDNNEKMVQNKYW